MPFHRKNQFLPPSFPPKFVSPCESTVVYWILNAQLKPSLHTASQETSLALQPPSGTAPWLCGPWLASLSGPVPVPPSLLFAAPCDCSILILSFSPARAGLVLLGTLALGWGIVESLASGQ